MGNRVVCDSTKCPVEVCNRLNCRFLPSLVNNGQSRTKNKLNSLWSRVTRRRYRSLRSWITAQRGLGNQLLRVDVTSVKGRSIKLSEAFKLLRRKVEKTFGTEINYYKIETVEGHGVLHMVWAVNSDRAAWIPQKWLSDTWFSITGAKIVYVKRIHEGSRHDNRVGSYLVTQYLAGEHHESLIVRVSYSWWRNRLPLGRGWLAVWRFCRSSFQSYYDQKSSPFRSPLTMQELVHGWADLLTSGRWCFQGGEFFMSGCGDGIYLKTGEGLSLIFPSRQEILSRG